MVKKLLLGIMVMAAGLFILTAPLATADSTNHIFGACGQAATNNSVCASKNTTQNPVTKTIKAAADIIASVAGIAAVIMAIVSGLTMASSGGNSEAVANAKKQLTYALIGLVVIALAWAITRFVVDVIL